MNHNGRSRRRGAIGAPWYYSYVVFMILLVLLDVAAIVIASIALSRTFPSCSNQCINGSRGAPGENASVIVTVINLSNDTNVTDVVYNTTLFNVYINISENATFISTPGPDGPQGIQGIPGIAGANGTSGMNGVNGTNGAVDFADFFALMPGNNTATVAVGGDLQLPLVGPAKSGTGITSSSATQVNLAAVGTYEVSFFVSIAEAGQLVITLNNVEQSHTVSGRATDTNYIMANLLISTITTNTLLTVRNPVANAAALTVTPTSGGVDTVSAHLVIIRLV